MSTKGPDGHLLVGLQGERDAGLPRTQACSARAVRTASSGVGSVVGGVDHAADQRDVERPGEVKIAARCSGRRRGCRAPASRRTSRRDACSSASAVVVVAVDRRVVADLEQLDVPRGCLRRSCRSRISGEVAVSCHCQKKA